MNFEIWDLPGQIDFLDPSFDIGELGALVWVIDAQADYYDTLCLLYPTIMHVRGKNPKINIEIFIHKVDGLSSDCQQDVKEDIIHRTLNELQYNGFGDTPISFHLTSIYDYSVQEALSKVIQKVIPHAKTMENLLDLLCSTSGIHKAFLVDTMSKIYIATNSSPVDSEIFGMLCDFIEFFGGVSDIYGCGCSRFYTKLCLPSDCLYAQTRSEVPR